MSQGKLSDLIKTTLHNQTPAPEKAGHKAAESAPAGDGAKSSPNNSPRRASPFLPRAITRLPGFDLEYVTAKNTGYQHCDDRMQSTLAGGVLPAGVPVWLMPALLKTHSSKLTVGFVEDIGLVNVSPQSLRKADAPGPDGSSRRVH